MAQKKDGNVDFTNGSTAITFHDAGVDSTHVGKPIKRQGANTEYIIQSIDQPNQTGVLNQQYQGTTESGAPYVILMDFTDNLNLAEINKGEVDAAHIITRGLRDIDEMLPPVIQFVVPGTITTGTKKDGPRRLWFSGVIKKVVAYRGTDGTSGSTIVDVNINGTSIFSAKPTIPYDDADDEDEGTIDTDHDDFAEGDILTMDIDQVEGGTPGDLVVMVIPGR